MRIIFIVAIERLHRFVFDHYYVQSYRITLLNRIVLRLSSFLERKNNDWRYELHKYSKTLTRYSKESLIIQYYENRTNLG